VAADLTGRFDGDEESMNAIFRFGILGLIAALLGGGSGCTQEFVANQTATRSAGAVSVVILNNTPFRASLMFGSYDALDRADEAPMSFQQARVEAFQTEGPREVQCRRNLAVGTDELMRRALQSNQDQQSTFDPEIFFTTVNFSDAPNDSPAATLPTEGSARGREVLLGVHYTCADRVVFVLEQDEDAPGGFRIDFFVVPNAEDTTTGSGGGL
jgi:hypothetical protein